MFAAPCRFDNALRKLLINEPSPELKHYVTGAFVKITTPFPEGKLVGARLFFC